MRYILTFIFTSFLFIVPARAEVQHHFTYAVYTGGMHVLEADMDLLWDGVQYKSTIRAKTHGMLGKLAPWSGEFVTDGRYKTSEFFPSQHRATSVWRGEDDEKKYSYDGKGNITAYSEMEAGKTKPPKDLTEELVKGTTDILSATFAVMHGLGNGNKCGRADEIFDGKRRFALAFEPVSEMTLKSSRYNIYSGHALKCSVEVKPVAGRWREKPRGWMSIQEQGRAKGQLPMIWFGKLLDSDLYVPVKIQVRTAYGTLMMHLTSISEAQGN